MKLSAFRRSPPIVRDIVCLSALCLLAACIPQATVENRERPRAGSAAPPRLETDASILGQSGTTPTWEAREVTRNATSVSATRYIVQSGDTLRSIGDRTGAGADMLALVNSIAPPYTIYSGQKLNVRAGRYHRVGTGETGIAIARAYGVSWQDVVTINGLTDPYILRAGQRLLLPEVAGETGDRLAKRAAAFNLGIDDIVSGGQPALAEGKSAVRPITKAVSKPSVQALAVPKAFSGNFRWPMDGRLLSGFGSKGGGKVNQGLDIAAPRGTPIRAAASGVVSYSGNEIAVYGGLILISHGAGWVTAYGHADRIDVVRGQAVDAGQVIGLSGESGYVSEPQLHFEIRKELKPVNPVLHLPAR